MLNILSTLKFLKFGLTEKTDTFSVPKCRVARTMEIGPIRNQNLIFTNNL